MDLFANREEAGERLAAVLAEKYGRKKNAVVLALPRGGVVPGRIVADELGAPLDIVVPRKIGAKANPEYAIGAVAEDGEAVWNEAERRVEDPSYLDAEVAAQRAEARRRLATYREGLPQRDLKGKSVIIVDDGAATGLTMRAAIATVRAERPARITVALPVCPPDTVRVLAGEADDVVALRRPEPFHAIGAFYEEFSQVGDADVRRLLRR